MAGAPTYQLLLDDGTGTFPYNITAYWRRSEGYELNRGRGDERSDVEAGELKQVVLNNKDGRFTPGSTIIASPSPIVADQRIRLQVTANGTTVNRFTGYVPSWVNSWPGGKSLAVVTVTATDAQARAERLPLRSVIQQEILEDSPTAYYTLGEAAGATSASDSSGNQAPPLTMVGTGTDIVFGSATGPETDGLTAAQFAGGKYLYASAIQFPLTYGFIVAFQIAAPPAAISTFAAYSSSSRSDVSLSILTDGKLRFDTDTGGSVTTSGNFADGSWHVAEIRNEFDLYVDGVFIGSVTAVPASVVPFVLTLGARLDGSQQFTGNLAHAAVLPLVSTARVSAHYTAIKKALLIESGTARLTRLAGYGNLPVGTLDTSFTNVPFVDFTGQSLTEALRDVADAEVGLLFFDGSGNLTFHNRMRAPLKTAPDITIPAEALDVGTQFVTDMQGILNYFEAVASGTGNGAQVARNMASETSHGRYPGSASYLVQTDAEALDRANWIMATHAEPQPRIGTLEIDAFSQTAALQAQLLSLEPNTWVRITGLPSQTPGGTTADLMVQGFTEKASAREWKITANVVARSMFQAWILGDSVQGVLGSTTRLYI